jgi:hypothetical protein
MPSNTHLPSGRTHHWVGAAIVSMGHGDTKRAEHAARTGRHVLDERTRVEVLEVYCARCRVKYSRRSCAAPCTGVMAHAG